MSKITRAEFSKDPRKYIKLASDDNPLVVYRSDGEVSLVIGGRLDLDKPLCIECPFSKDGEPNKPVYGEGKLGSAKLAIVGEGPGGEEIKQGRPFVGRSGRLLQSVLKSVGLPRHRVYLTNATLCPPKGDSEEARKQAAICCKPRLDAELAGFREPIVTLGGVAASTMLGRNLSILKESGTAEQVNGSWILKGIHPAAILRSVGSAQCPDAGVWALHHLFKNALSLFNGKATILDNYPLDLFYSKEQVGLEEALVSRYEEARKLGWLAIDTETLPTHPKYSALSAKFAGLEAIGLATPTRAVSSIYGLLTPNLTDIFRDLLRDPNIAKVCHNLSYDLAVLKANGFEVRGDLHDTLLAHHAVFPGALHKLQIAVAYYMVCGPWKDEFRSKADSDEDHTRYNAKDTLGTAILHKELQEELDEYEVREVYDNDRLMAQIAAEMHLWGMPIDRDENERLKRVFSGKCGEQYGKLQERAQEVSEGIWESLAKEQALFRRKKDPEDYQDRIAKRLSEIDKELAKGRLSWTPSNPSHIAALCEALGDPIQYRTPTGKVSTKKEILEEMAARLPIVAGITIWKENAKMLSTFVDPMFSRVIDGMSVPGWEVDGRIHPIWSVNQLPGRWAARDPGVMTLPKDDEKLGRPNLRSQIKAPEGRVIVGFDYAQMHPRIIAGMSQDKALMEIIADESKDIHTECARMVWKGYDELPQVDKKSLRQAIKAPEYSFWYKGSPYTAWVQAAKKSPGTTIQDINFMYSRLEKGFPGVVAWQDKLIKQVAKEPYEVRDGFGGRRQCFLLGNPSESAVVNFPVLSTETRIMQSGLARLWNGPLWTMKDAWIIHQCHDSLALEVWEGDADKAIGILKDCFEVEFRGVLMKIDPGVGKSLGDV